MSSRSLIFGGSGGTRPSGGLSGVTSGIGMGIGTLLIGSWMKTIGSSLLLLVEGEGELLDVVVRVQSAVSAGCGTPTRISGPQ